ncbi:BLUF domain-containing protein [Hymenobacter sp. YC55]|uniref:BLUF domain-containing protein n=1 Tax=Hymenobacter sp. YC55 TaxID=3034019 RepID=UPI0023F96EA6|nr:BLUF domain-containing protein [Hymenobacter sp. YC55]MDF7815069.1 BLUF domain-containing protein [Hymenobacter sp. YC55]
MRHLAGILLVDDDTTSTFLSARLLRHLALTDHLLVAENGAEGWQLLQDVLAPPAPADQGLWLVLLDVNMPVFDGFAFLEAYQHLPAVQQQRVAVVMLTTSLHGADLERLQDLPIAGIVSKPLTEEKVRTLLRENLPTSLRAGSELPDRVFQLVYRSQATRPLPEAELLSLLSHARQANAAVQVTGILVYWKGCFVQVLEGAEADVRALYARIQQDPRHSQVVTVSEARARPRHFAQWRMALGRDTAPAVIGLFELALNPPVVGGVLLLEVVLQDVGGALERSYS